MNDHQVFDKEEVDAIVRRATEIQFAEGPPQNSADGIRRADLEKIAVELGIAPEALDRAILERMVRLPAPKPGLVSDYVQTLPGTVPIDRFDRILEKAGTPLRRGQYTAQVGRTLMNATLQRGGRTRVTVRSDEEGTRVKVHTVAVFPALVAFLGTFYTFLFSMPAVEAGSLSLAMMLSIVGLVGAALVALGVFWSKWTHEGAQKLLRDVVGECSRQIAATQPRPATDAVRDSLASPPSGANNPDGTPRVSVQ